jgi:hypothetical protein
MWWAIFYVFFSSFFTFGVTHAEDDRLFDTIIKMILCILAGWFMMPIYLGSWLDLNKRS